MKPNSIQAVYDKIAPQFAILNAKMPDSLAVAAKNFLNRIGTEAIILDLGCGTGRDMAWFEAQNCRVIGVDLSIGMLQQAQAVVQGPLLQMDIASLGFRNQVFKGIWCNTVLLHFSYPQIRDLLLHLYHILAPDGTLFLSLKEGAGECWAREPYSIPRRFRRYSQSEIATLSIESGFEILDQTIIPTPSDRWLYFLITKRRRQQ